MSVLVKTVEREIERREGFVVRIRHPSGRDVRGDKTGLPRYPYRNAAAGNITVQQFVSNRLAPSFTGWSFVVYDGSGTPATPRTRLATVRATYNL